MGEGDWDNPELPIFSMPWHNFPEPPGLLTPPLHPGAMVPFKWEEVPGRPRPWLAQSPVVTEGVKRCLDLPPRLLSDRQGTTTTVANSITILSPTTVLEGPYPCHRKRPTKTWSFGLLGSREKMAFGSSRWAVSVPGNLHVIARRSKHQEAKIAGVLQEPRSPSSTAATATGSRRTAIPRSRSLESRGGGEASSAFHPQNPIYGRAFMKESNRWSHGGAPARTRQEKKANYI